jgi:dienelactone hydrolase
MNLANEVAAKSRLSQIQVPNTALPIKVFFREDESFSEVLYIYIEGDGHTWTSQHFPSKDPTPYDPIALKMAANQSAGVAAYLGRPCQFFSIDQQPQCNHKVWTSGQYSQAAVESTMKAIDYLKIKSGAHSLVLVGYSGGAMMALLCASMRSDVIGIVTVAGNLDSAAFVNFHNLPAMDQFYKPETVFANIHKIKQVHFVGEMDKVIPPNLNANFFKQFTNDTKPEIIILPENGHICCWDSQWPNLWRLIPPF